jgi:hypothetical protein
MLLATVAGLAGSLDDRTGAFLVTTTATVAAIGILLVGYLQRTRNPMPARHRTRSAVVASSSIVTTAPPADTPSFLADEDAWVEDPAQVENGLQEPPSDALRASDADGEAILIEETAPLAAGGSDAFSSGVDDSGPPGDSPTAAEPTDSASWRLADSAADNGSEDTDLAETEEAMDAGSATRVRHLTGLSRSRPDDEDPSSGDS